MSKKFCRYSATGNTFLIFDNRSGELSDLPKETYASWCHDHGVDGLLFVENAREESFDFHMRYLNADGGEVEMCGNGARSILHFVSHELKMAPQNKSYKFSTQKGVYFGKGEEGFPVQMTEIYDWQAIDVSDLTPNKFSYYLNTGVPHALYEVENLTALDLLKEGAKVRYDERFSKGANANFFEVLKKGHVSMRTYERGVEGETLSCGTGATAVALALAKERNWSSPISVQVPGGLLKISFDENFSEVYLEGPVDLLERSSLK